MNKYSRERGRERERRDGKSAPKQIERYYSILECNVNNSTKRSGKSDRNIDQHHQRHIKNKQMNKINVHKLLFAMAICQTNENIVGHLICLWCTRDRERVQELVCSYWFMLNNCSEARWHDIWAACCSSYTHSCTLFIYGCIWLFFILQQKVEILRLPNWTSLDFICILLCIFGLVVVLHLLLCLFLSFLSRFALTHLPISSHKLFAFIVLVSSLFHLSFKWMWLCNRFQLIIIQITELRVNFIDEELLRQWTDYYSEREKRTERSYD